MIEQVGFLAAALLAEAETQAVKTAVGAGMDALKAGIGRIRRWFSDRDDEAGTAALDALVSGQDIDLNRPAVGLRLQRLAEADPAIRAELEQLVTAAQDAGADIGQAAQVANGDHNQMISNSPGAQINVQIWTAPGQPS